MPFCKCGNIRHTQKRKKGSGFSSCRGGVARIQIFRLLGLTKLFLWLFKITRFFKNYMDFPYENKPGENFFPQSFIFIWRSHLKISGNGNFQTAVKIVWHVGMTQNFAFRHKLRRRIWIWHPFCFRFNGYHKPRSDVENRVRESFGTHFEKRSDK